MSFRFQSLIDDSYNERYESIVIRYLTCFDKKNFVWYNAILIWFWNNDSLKSKVQYTWSEASLSISSTKSVSTPWNRILSLRNFEHFDYHKMDILFIMVYDSLFYILIIELRFYGCCHPCLYSVLVPINQQDGKILPTVHLAKFTQSSILWYYCSENLLNNLITIDFSHACIYFAYI